MLKDGQRGQAVLRGRRPARRRRLTRCSLSGDRLHRAGDHPALARRRRRPADRLPGHRRRPAPAAAASAMPLGPNGWRGESGVLAARDDAELEGLDADDAGRLLLLVWNVGGGAASSSCSTPATDESPAGRRAARSGGLRRAAQPRRPTRGAGRRGPGAAAGAVAPGHRHADAGRRATGRPPLPDARAGACRRWRLPGRDGLPLTGWLYRAPGRVEPGPAMLSLHGGPEAQERPTFNPQHQAMVAAGITVFAPNIRGSSGFGRAFVHADDVHGRRDAFDDVLGLPGLPGRPSGIAEPGADRRDRPLVRRLPDARLAGLLPGRLRRRRGHLRHVGPAHLLPRHRAVDRRRGGQQVRRPGARPGAAARPSPRCRLAGEHRRPAAGRARRAGHATCRSARRARSSRRCGRWAARWSTCSWTARATSTAEPIPGCC